MGRVLPGGGGGRRVSVIRRRERGRRRGVESEGIAIFLVLF